MQSFSSTTLEVAAPGKSAAPARLGRDDRRWFVVHTRPRREKALSRALASADVEHFLPLVECVTYRGSRKRVVLKPLFSSYLFMRGEIETTYFATSTKHVAKLLPVNDQQRFGNEIDQIRRALESGAELRSHRFFEVGRRVRVRTGPFQGIEGVVEGRPSVDRLVLQITTLGRATSLNIEADLLDPLD